MNKLDFKIRYIVIKLSVHPSKKNALNGVDRIVVLITANCCRRPGRHFLGQWPVLRLLSWCGGLRKFIVSGLGFMLLLWLYSGHGGSIMELKRKMGLRLKPLRSRQKEIGDSRLLIQGMFVINY